MVREDKAMPPQESAMKALLSSFADMIDEAAETMTHEEFMEASLRANEALDRAIKRAKQRRGMAQIEKRSKGGP